VIKPPRDPRIGELVGIARELAKVAGFEAAETLMFHFGGQRLNVPQKMRPSSPFWKVLGGDVAKKLAAIANKGGAQGSGADVDIPRGSRLMIARKRAAIAAFGGSKNEAAARFGIHRRTVQRHRRGSIDAGPLFEGLADRSSTNS
jgi:hypothetical protein